jgi:hypothetical protein
MSDISIHTRVTLADMRRTPTKHRLYLTNDGHIVMVVAEDQTNLIEGLRILLGAKSADTMPAPCWDEAELARRNAVAAAGGRMKGDF